MTRGAALDFVAAELERRLPGRVERVASSAPLVTYRCGGPLAVVVRPASEGDALCVAETVRARPVPIIVIGRGSNLLVADAGFGGLAVVLSGAFEEIVFEWEAGHVDAGGAAPLPVVARRAAAAGLGGLEFYVGIPGTVGGAVRMNAAGHGRETREVLVVARVLDLATAEVRDAGVEELDLAYRRSALRPDEVVLGARLAAAPDDPAACGQRLAEVVRWRREHQPGGANAGSVFRNPPGDVAGRLVDACGLKGARVGGATVSEKHANFIVADPGATAADVRALIEQVRSAVAAETGVVLETELRMIGFGPSGGAEGATTEGAPE